MPLYYVETDGKLLLREQEGQLGFPESENQLDFEIQPLETMHIKGQKVVYSLPLLDHHPEQWVNKDDIPLMPDIHPIVREAVQCTFPRLVVEAVIERESKIMLVQPRRGYNAGKWTLPGGFLVYGESPESAVKREVEEEVGVELDLGPLLNTFSHIGGENNYHWLLFFYQGALPPEADEPTPNHEISEIRWFDRKQAPAEIWSPLMAEGLEQIVEENASFEN